MPQTSTQRAAADAVAAWLARNEKNYAWLVEKASLDPGTVGDFLNGKRWPKVGNQGKIERALGWPAGTIRHLGNGDDVSRDVLESAPPGASQGTVGGDPHDHRFVAAPGERADGGASDSEVLQAIREMQQDIRAMRERLDKIDERGT